MLLCHRSRFLCECLAAALKASRRGFDCVTLNHEAPLAAWTELVPTEKADVLLIDPTLPDGRMSYVIESVRHRSPECKLMLLISIGAVEGIINLTHLGCHGWIFEEVSLSDVCEAIDTVLAGRPYCSPQLAHSLLAQLGRNDMRRGWLQNLDDAGLTAREREILQLIAWENLSNKQIARRLHVSLYTVKNHVHNLIEKMGASDRHDAARLAQRRNMLRVAAAE